MKNWLTHLKLLPTYFSIIVLPLAMRFVLITLPGEQAITFKNDTMGDFYMEFKYRLMLFTLIAGIIIIIANWSYVKDRIKGTKSIYWFLALLGSFLISTIFSPYPYTSIHGYFQIREGLFSWLGYFIIFTNAFIFYDAKAKKGLFYAFVWTSLFSSLFLLIQHFGYDPIQQTWFKLNFLMSSKNAVYEPQIAKGFTFVAGTLFNPNFVGSYYAVLLLVFISWLQKHEQKILLLVAIFLGYAGMLASKSSAGIVAFGLGLLILLLLQFKSFFKSRYNLILLGGLLLVSVFFTDSLSSNVKDVSSPFSGETEKFVAKRVIVDEFKIEEGRLELVSPNVRDFAYLALENGEMMFLNDHDEPLQYQFDSVEQIISFDHPDYQYLKLQFYDANLFSIMINGLEVPFGKDGTTFSLLGLRLQPIDHTPVESIGFKGYERIGSGRGYIWSRSLPLILDRPLFGHGPNTYALAFPQHDVAGKVSYMGQVHIIVDKPHNFYIHMLVTVGFVGSLLYAGFILSFGKAMYQLKRLKWFVPIGVAFFTVLFFNDSMIFTSNVMYTIMGLALVKEKDVFLLSDR